MEAQNEFSHDEECYSGITYDDFIKDFPISCHRSAHLGYEGFDFSRGTDDSGSFSPFLDNIRRTAHEITSLEKVLKSNRRIFWGYFLGAYKEDSLHKLTNFVVESRKSYWHLVDHYKKHNSITAIQRLDPQIFHPLAPIETNPWAKSQLSKELMEEIWQDVERTYQERSLFQRETARKSLQRILYVWSMEHSYISYKQGMNELLAIIYIVCYRDQVKHPLDHEATLDDFEILCSCLPKDVEADAFTLFSSLMTLDLQLMYDISAIKLLKNADPFTQDRINALLKAANPESDNPLIARCNYIYHTLLKDNDLTLYAHLKDIELEPHLFLMRWIRLIFSREFNVNETLNLWDTILADHYLDKEGSTAHFQLHFIDCFSVAMLIFVRKNLLENDINYCLQRLFKYPPVEDLWHLTLKAYEVKRRHAVHDTTVREPVMATYGDPDPLSTSNETTPKSVIIKILDATDDHYVETGQSERSGGHNDDHSGHSADHNGCGDVKTRLVEVASKVYGMYEAALGANYDSILASLKEVHGDITGLISLVDSHIP